MTTGIVKENVFMSDSIIYLNGEFFGKEDAKISVFDHGFLYGDGVFEAFKVQDGFIFGFNEHMARLYDSAKIVDLKIPLDPDEFKEAVIETVRRNGQKNCYVRPQVTRGVGALGHNPDTCEKPTIVIYVTGGSAIKKSSGLKVIVSAYRRPPSYILPPECKITNYCNNILAKLEAQAAGVPDAIMLDVRGFVAEGCAWNIFVIKNQIVSTPSATSSILKGINRNLVVDIVKKLGYPMEERDISISELFTADEVFCTGTSVEITPIIQVNGRTVGNGSQGTITKDINREYDKVKRELGINVF